MNCAGKNCVYALLVAFFIFSQSVTVSGKDGKDGRASGPENISPVSNSIDEQHFQWNDHKKLSWSDFRGAVNATSDESAAATHCGIGFKTVNSTRGKKPEIVVYNTFYTEKSWVRPDAKMQSILNHEQGHFDLCEIYTRKLRASMNQFDFNVPDVKAALIKIYSQISSEYESRQQSYEEETTHGTNLAQQRKWCETIARELM